MIGSPGNTKLENALDCVGTRVVYFFPKLGVKHFKTLFYHNVSISNAKDNIIIRV